MKNNEEIEFSGSTESSESSESSTESKRERRKIWSWTKEVVSIAKKNKRASEFDPIDLQQN